jgi:hypothetical protein
MSESAEILIVVILCTFMGALAGWVGGHSSGYNRAREIWDPDYEPVTLKRSDHEDFKTWKHQKDTEKSRRSIK